ncbi:MAG: LacI family DNA-binding transcriptional regulator [Verrucomicrobiota bacterium]
MEPRVLIRDVAGRAGVSPATVSRALRDDPRIRAGVRARVRALADEMGYRPDPHLRALAKYRAQGRAAEFRGVLAWVTNERRRDGWRHYEKAAYFDGAKRRAAELGYDVEHFWASEPGLTPARLRQILHTRGVRGVLLPPPSPDRPRVELPWEGLAVVSFGCSRVEPRLHSIHNHHYRSMELLLAELKALGYRRPGLALSRSINASVDGAWSAAYFNFNYESAGALPVPLIADGWGAAELLAWRSARRVDVVLSDSHHVLDWLRESGLKVPAQCGFAMTGRHRGHPDCAGIDENSPVIGASAVDLLTSLVERGESGVPAHPQNVLIEGFWSPLGATVRRQRS